MNENPLVSILLLSMNHEPYIEQCIKSVVSQSYQNIEILYLDNASKDDTFTIAEKTLANSGVSFKVFRNDESKGICANLNFMYSKSSGEFITALSTDDWWSKENLEQKVGLFLKNPGAGLVYSDGYIYHNENKKILFSEQDKLQSGWILKQLLVYNFIKAPSVLIPRKVIDDVGFYDDKLLIEDWDLWIRIAEKYEILLSSNPTIYYRYAHGGNLSSKATFMIKAVDQMVEKYINKYPFEMKKVKKKNMLRLAKIVASGKQDRKSVKWMFSNFQFNLFYVKLLIKHLFIQGKSLAEQD